jgi:hypothetical protein
MSRHGYVDDYDKDGTGGLYRGAVVRAFRGKRGQDFLREMAAALDAMPVKELVAGEIVRDGAHVCAIGSVAVARGRDVAKLDVEDWEAVAKTFGIANSMVREITYENDDGPRETDAERWTRMRKWVDRKIVATTTRRSASAPSSAPVAVEKKGRET